MKYGFVAIEKSAVELSQCVVCLDTLSSNALWPTRLQQHLHYLHPEFSKKPVKFFCAKRDSLSQMRLDKKGKPSPDCAQLIVYARFIANDTIEEGLPFSPLLKTTTKGADVFQALSQLFEQALVAKTVPDDLREDLNFAVEVVNYVKCSALNTRLFAALCESLNADHMVLLYHTEVCWLSKGNMLCQIYELKEAVAELLEQRGRRTMCRAFKSEHFQFSLAYLADIFEALNSLNLKLQGANANVMAHYDIVQSFIAKISLCDKCLCEDLKRKIKGHLRGLQDEFFHYFPDVEPQNLIYKLVRNPFLVNVEDLPHDLQEEAIELQFNNLAKDSFESMPLENFWVKLQAEYPKISSQSLRILVPFSSTYLCETGFSALMTLNTQHRNRLNVESDLRCTLSPTPPRIDNIVANKHCQYSH
ncbi:Zinc finger BED domain-containing protein 5, partial [Trichinella papuae]